MLSAWTEIQISRSESASENAIIKRLTANNTFPRATKPAKSMSMQSTHTKMLQTPPACRYLIRFTRCRKLVI